MILHFGVVELELLLLLLLLLDDGQVMSLLEIPETASTQRMDHPAARATIKYATITTPKLLRIAVVAVTRLAVANGIRLQTKYV